MTERIRDTGDELVLYDDQQALLRVSGPTRLLGAAHGGVHVLTGGRLQVAGISRQRLVIDTGGTCHASGYIRAVPKVAEGGFLDVTGHLNPVRWPVADIEGTILIAVAVGQERWARPRSRRPVVSLVDTRPEHGRLFSVTGASCESTPSFGARRTAERWTRRSRR